MDDSEEAPANDAHEAQVGDASGAVHTGRGDVIRPGEIERLAKRARDALQHSQW